MGSGRKYKYDSRDEYISQPANKGKRYKPWKAFLIMAGYFLGTELLVSFAVVTPPMLRIFPNILLVSIALCLLALAGYVALVIFGCYKLLKKIEPEDFSKIAYPAYGVVIAISALILLVIGMGGTLVKWGWISEDVVSGFQQVIVWCFAPMRLLRMFSLDNIYSIAISHIVCLGAITVTHTLIERKNEEIEGNIKRHRRVIKRKQNVDVSCMRRRKTGKTRELKQPQRKRARARNITGIMNRSGKPRRRSNHAGRGGLTNTMRKLERIGRRRH